MLIKKIKLKNFMSISELDLDFTNNIYTVITGDNASGKSSLLEAIAMALLERRKGDSYRDYVQTGKKESTIDIITVLGGKELRIVTTINNKSYGTPVQRTIYLGKEIYQNSECTSLLKTFKVQYLQHITFFHQKDTSILNLRPAEVSALLKELFEIDYTIQASRIFQEIETFEQSSLTLQAKLSTLESVYESSRTSPLMENPTSKIAIEEEALFSLNKELASYTDAQNSVKELKNKEIALSEVKKEIAGEEDNFASLDLGIKSYKTRVESICREVEQFQSELLKEYDDGVISNLESSIHLLNETLQETKDYIPSKRSKLSNLDRELSAYEEGTCPVCNHDLSEESNKISVLKGEIKLITEEVSAKSLSINVISKDLSERKKELLREKKERDGIILNKKKAEIHISSLQRERTNALKTMISLNTQLVTCSHKLSVLKEKKDKVLQRINELSVYAKDAEVLLRIKSEISSLEKSLISLRRVNVINEERAKNNKITVERKRAVLAQINEIKDDINSTASKLMCHKEALSIILNEFPNYVILQKTTLLETSINNYVKKIFPDMTVKLILKRSGISFYYSPKSSEDFLPAKMASGAQSAILMLAWRVSLAEMYGIDTLILDEIDADATDENSSIIYEFIGSLSAFDQIIIISHRKSSIKTIRDSNENVRCFWVTDGEYEENSSELNI